MRLDNYDEFPPGMKRYLSFHGWHFSKKMCDWAVSRMRCHDKDTGRSVSIDAYSPEDTERILQKYRITIENVKGYDHVYVLNMAKADFLGSSIDGECKLAMFVKDYIDDPDGYEGLPFTRFLADCIGSGTPIPWEDVLND